MVERRSGFSIGRTSSGSGSSSRAVRVLVVDDSAVIRGLITRALEEDRDIIVVSSASNGKMAVSTVAREEIDVVVLDIEMPVMDGLTALPLILEARKGVQVIMASTLTLKNADISIQALRAGASDYVPKPSSGVALNSAQDFKRELREKVKALGRRARLFRPRKAIAEMTEGTRTSFWSRSSSGRSGGSALPSVGSAATPTPGLRGVAASGGGKLTFQKPSPLPATCLAIGSSTGGPQALFKVFAELKGELNLPVLITQHMPATFTAMLADHLGRVSGMMAKEAEDGEPLRAGTIYVAPGDYHMIVENVGAGQIIRLTQTPPENYCRPAVDPMLRSLSKVFGKRLLTVILTGMGHDGLKGGREVVQAGGTLLAQDEDTSVVWGMPGAVANAGLCSEVLPLDKVAEEIKKHVMRSAA